MCLNKHSLQLNNLRMCHTLNMIFFANVHKSIADEQENWRAPEGIFWSFINRLRDTLSSGCVLLCPLLRAAESLSWNKDKEEEESER